MKTYSRILSLLLLVLVVFAAGCKKDDDPGETEEERQTRELSQTWETGSVRYTDETSDIPGFDNFTITFNSNGTFTTSGGQSGVSYLPSSGTWSFNGTNLNSVNLEDNGNTVTISISTLTETSLVFNVDGPGVKSTDPDRPITYTLVPSN